LGILVGPEELAGGDRVDTLGAVALFIAALSWSIGSLYSRKAPLTNSPFLNTSMQMIAGGAALFALGFMSGEWNRLEMSAISFRSFLSWGYLAIFGSLVGFSAYIWLLKVTTPAKVSTYAYVNPLVAVFFGWLLAEEEISLRTILASSVIIASVVIITLPKNFNGWKIPLLASKTPVEP
jgi:drug/metabolite transporter (DMT)-like permease